MKKLIITSLFIFFIGTLTHATSCTQKPGPHDSLSVKVPNIFTPNNDGVNDTWSIILHDYGISLIDLQTTVYDRWGVPVFQSTNINQVWLGHTPTGRLCSAGSYFYIISYTNGATGALEELKGYVELVR
jgi:gliding motility-associated-like protein